MIAMQCITCRAVFNVELHQKTTAKYCSRACQSIGHGQAMIKRIVVVCQECHQSLTCRPSQAHPYCSRSCSAQANGRNARQPPRIHVCGQCHLQFQAERITQRFCSPHCASLSFMRRVEKQCETCGLKHMTRSKWHKRFCSTRCRTIGLGRSNTAIERKMGEIMIKAGLSPVPHYPVDKLTLDFAFPSERICIECDGIYWHGLPEVQQRDKRRDAFLRNRGWIVVRLPEQAIHESPDECLAQVQAALSQRNTSAHLLNTSPARS